MNFRSRRTSRRHFIHGVAAAGVSGLAFAQNLSSKESAAAFPRTLALIGDRYHNSDFIRVALTRLFDSLSLPVDFTINYQDVSAALLNRYQLFICFRDGLIWPKGYLGPDSYPYTGDLENRDDWPESTAEGWITEEQGKAVMDFVVGGNGFYALHNSSHISLYSKEFREVMGGAYIGHPPIRPFKVIITDPWHPITKGVHDFVVTDEQHYVSYDKDPKNIILRSENIDGLRFENHGTRSIAGWAYDYGKGRMVFTAVGHTLHAMWQPEYVKIQQNAVQWLLRRPSLPS